MAAAEHSRKMLAESVYEYYFGIILAFKLDKTLEMGKTLGRWRHEFYGTSASILNLKGPSILQTVSALLLQNNP